VQEKVEEKREIRGLKEEGTEVYGRGWGNSMAEK